MTTPAEQQGTFVRRDVTLARILLFIGCVLFVIAALCAGDVLKNQSAWAWAFGGFAAWVLAGAV